jgi:hypothetical protein
MKRHLIVVILGSGIFISACAGSNPGAGNAPPNPAAPSTSSSAPPLVFTPPAQLADTVVGTQVNISFATLGMPSGGRPPYHYQLDSGVGFPPVGLVMDTNGILTGVPAAINGSEKVSNFSVCVVDLAGTSKCVPISMKITDPIVGPWSGTITVRVYCVDVLPQVFNWSADITRLGGNSLNVHLKVPGFFLDENEVATLTDRHIQFAVDVGDEAGAWRFSGDATADLRRITGNFVGVNCNIPPVIVVPSGDWQGARN